MFRINNLKTIALLTLCQDRTMQYSKVQCQFYNYSLFQWVVFLVESRSSFDTNQPFSHSSVYVGLVLPAEVIYISFTLSFFHLLTTFWHVVSFFLFISEPIWSSLSWKRRQKGGTVSLRDPCSPWSPAPTTSARLSSTRSSCW